MSAPTRLKWMRPICAWRAKVSAASGELELGLGQRVGGDCRLEIRRRIVVRIEADAVDLREIGDRRLGARVGGAIGDPQRRVVARLVERLDAGAIGLSRRPARSNCLPAINSRSLSAMALSATSLARRRLSAGSACRQSWRGLFRLDLRDPKRAPPGPAGFVDILHRQRRGQRGVRHRHRCFDWLIGLLRHARMAGQQPARAPRQSRPARLLNRGLFTTFLPKLSQGGRAPYMSRPVI